MTTDKVRVQMPLFLGMLAAVVFSLYTVRGYAEVDTAIGSDVSSQELRSFTIESWDNDLSGGGYGWEVVTNRDSTKPGDRYEAVYSNAQVLREVKLLPGTPKDIRENLDYDQVKILGFQFAFTFPGDNVVTVRPAYVDDYIIERPRPHLYETAIQEDVYQRPDCYQDASRSRYPKNARAFVVDCVVGVEMPGRVEKVSVWVLGRGNDAELEGWVEDWRGDIHIIKFGSLDFVGWRPMVATIPERIPQDADSYPQIRTLVFRQFKIRIHPEAPPVTVILYFDELRVLSTIFEVHYDGAQIDFDQQDCNSKNAMLSLVRKNARNPDAFTKPVDCSNAPAAPPAGGGGAGAP